MEDYQIWNSTCDEDLWIYDKLILSKKLKYLCGPVCVEPPKSDYYIIRPCVNICGMGKGAYIKYLDSKLEYDHLPAGYFWCEMFGGKHYSVDFVNKKQQLTTEGTRKLDDPLWKWSKWKKVNKKFAYPDILNTLVDKYTTINCEFIGDKLIEVHLRPNNDMDDYDEIIPVWAEDNINISDWTSRGYKWKEAPDLAIARSKYARLGFLGK